ncbi:MAG: hypothetical protein RL219_72 [Actinomycetota bacterium]
MRFVRPTAAIAVLSATLLPAAASLAQTDASPTTRPQLVSAPLAIDAEADLVVALGGFEVSPAAVSVSAHLLDNNVVDLDTALTQPLGAPLDSVTVADDRLVVDDGVLTITIPTESVTDLPSRLRLEKSGLYVIAVRVNAGAALPIPVVRRARGDGAPPIPVTVVLSVDTPISLQPDGTTTIAASTRKRIERLSAFLGDSQVPVSVAVRPELLESLSKADESGRQLVAELADDFGRQRLLSTPYLHIDPSVAANAGLTNEFTTQLRYGEDVLSNTLQRLPDRRVWVATDPLSPAGASLVRNLGAVVVLQTAGAAKDLSGTPATSSLSQPVLVPADIAEALAAETDDPMVAARNIALELARAEQDDARPAIVLAPDLDTARPDTLRALMSVLAAGVLVQGVDVEQVGIGTTATPTPTDSEVVDASGIRQQRQRLTRTIEATSAILPIDDARRATWPIRADVLLDTRLTTEERAAYVEGVRNEMLAVQNNVILQVPKAVNLGDRKTNIPITIQNDNDVPVSVAVRLVSAKLRFPPVSDVVVVEPGATVFLDIPVSARSNGRFPVTAQLLAPGTTLTVGRSAVMNVRVGRLTGLGIVVTFAAGLALLSWWAQHLRRRWRRAETAEIERRHRAGLPTDDLDDVVPFEEAATIEQPVVPSARLQTEAPESTREIPQGPDAVP